MAFGCKGRGVVRMAPTAKLIESVEEHRQVELGWEKEVLQSDNIDSQLLTLKRIKFIMCYC